MSAGLTIELPSPSVTALRAAELLLRERQLNARVRITGKPQSAPGPRVLRIESASVVRPLLTVLWGDDPSREPSINDLRMALSREIWADSVAPEPWRVTAGPLPERLRLGTPDPDRPWVVIAPGVTTSTAHVATVTNLDNAQLHFVGTGSAEGGRKSVRWLPKGSIVCSLLGHADAVIAPPGPLAWDAQRAGVPVFDPSSTPDIADELAMRRLTQTVPALLVGDAGFWRRLAADLLNGAAHARWGTVSWMLHASEKATGRFAADHPNLHAFKPTNVKRKLRKLRRDPAAFWNDSWIARRGHGFRGK